MNFAKVKLGLSVSQIKKQAKVYEALTDAELSDIALDLGFESRQNESVLPLIVRGFALVQVAAKRQLGMQH